MNDSESTEMEVVFTYCQMCTLSPLKKKLKSTLTFVFKNQLKVTKGEEGLTAFRKRVNWGKVTIMIYKIALPINLI